MKAPLAVSACRMEVFPYGRRETAAGSVTTWAEALSRGEMRDKTSSEAYSSPRW
jgi:hypothetical protein